MRQNLLLFRSCGNLLAAKAVRNGQVIPSRPFSVSLKMAKSKYDYVKDFEHEDNCLPNCWIVVRIDGRNFSKFADAHQFIKPNDLAALELMNRAAMTVMEDFREIVIAYGQSDEYSFVFRKDTQLFKRRASKLMSNVNSLFAASYVYYWPRFFKNRELHYPPSFDARVVLYPTDKNLRDYLAWRQADVHINNLYNTCFWNLVLKSQMTPQKAEERLSGTMSSQKNEMLFHDFKMNYNNEPAIYRKGTTLIRKLVSNGIGRLKPTIVPLADDIIGDRFWKENPEVIGLKSLGTYQLPMNNIPAPIAIPNSIHPSMPVKPLHQGNVIQAPPMNSVHACSPMKKSAIDTNKQDSIREPNRNGDPSGSN